MQSPNRNLANLSRQPSRSEIVAGESQLLALPVELLHATLTHLLGTEQVSLRNLATGPRYDFNPAVMRVNIQLRDASAQVLHRNQFVYLAYTGPRHAAPGPLFPKMAPKDYRMYMDGSKTVTVGIAVSSTSGEVGYTECCVMTPRVFQEYIAQLAARQTTWPPASMPGYHQPPEIQHEPGLTYRIHVSALGSCRYQWTRAKCLLLEGLNQLTHCGDRCDIQFLGTHLPMQTIHVESYVARTLLLQRNRKDRLDAIIRAGVWKESQWVGDLVQEYRQLCHDLQLFVASERTMKNPSYAEAFQAHSREIWQLVATIFYTFTSLYYHPAVLEIPDMAPLPFEPPCKEEVCPCAIVAVQNQPRVSFLEQLLLLSGLSTPPPLWYKLEVQIAFIHLVIYKPDDEFERTLPCLLRRLEQIRLSLRSAGVMEDFSLVQDIAMVRHAMRYGLHPREGTDEGALKQKWYILWCRTSLQSESIEIAPSHGRGTEVCADRVGQLGTEESFLGRGHASAQSTVE